MKRSWIPITIAGLLGAAAGWVTGCGSNGTTSGVEGDSGGSGVACPACITDDDCNGGTCAQLGTDSFCVSACSNSGACAGDRSCADVESVSGKHVRACVTSGQGCDAPPGGDDGGATDASVAFDGGSGPPTGQVGADGGKLSRLLFGVVGDARPANYGDTAGYPTAIVTKIFDDIQALPARPPFVVSTGDYMFASTSGTGAGLQLDKYIAARAAYTGVELPAMGNHECTGATVSNCGPGATNGTTANYTAFMTKLLAPLAKTTPYYAVRVDAIDGSWTSKFVFIAANAWSSAQSSWLSTTMASTTTYTFVIRHEPHDTSGVTGVTESEQIMGQHPYTLAIVGHTHSYYHFPGKEIIVGNGGAPVTGGKNYGFAIIAQRADGAIVVDMIDYETGRADSRFHFAVKADGSAASP